MQWREIMAQSRSIAVGSAGVAANGHAHGQVTNLSRPPSPFHLGAFFGGLLRDLSRSRGLPISKSRISLWPHVSSPPFFPPLPFFPRFGLQLG
ncbi:hypothetical protein GQ53DRAFT_401562 [Thozetella sp. PMI_491]|nr:hypothetical protein GQ53DRAFT_401562 [Thozetella sp. PMI_491]